MIRDSRFTICLKRAALALLLSTLNFQPSTAFAQGNLTPPGAPAQTMKSLAQVEPRTPISSAPFTISVPGSYYLTTNVTTSVANAITIATNGVSLDLNGFTIYSTAANAALGGSAILIGNGVRNVTIQNGFIQGGVTNKAGVFSGPGFEYGIAPALTLGINTRIYGISISGCLSGGIYLLDGDSSVVESCTVRTVGGMGIYASTIKNSLAVDCGDDAINGDQVSDCRGECVGDGAGVTALTVLNCYGSSSSGTGLGATTAQNCFGTSSSGIGLNATRAAINCLGSSSSGTGLSAINANNCYGSSTSGKAMNAVNASFCTANRPGGTAIEATIATGCLATAGTNNITHKYNMP